LSEKDLSHFFGVKKIYHIRKQALSSLHDA